MKFVLALYLASLPLRAQTVSVWLTTDDQQALLQPQKALSFAPGFTETQPVILVDERQRYQTIEGFGGSFTDSSAYLINQKIPAAALNDTLLALFDHARGIGLSFVRNPMGASDLARSDYSYDDMPAGESDPGLAKFSIAHDQADIIPLLLRAKSINPKLKITASPWSPPGWMKTSGSLIGGSLQASAYGSFAAYLVKYVQAYAAAGVHVDYLTLQNEPLFVPGDYPGESMPAEQQLELLKNFVLPALASASLDTKVLVYDHNWDDPAYPTTVLSDPALASSPQIGGVAWHWYGGTPGVMAAQHSFQPGRNQYVTEASGGTWITDEVKTDFETIVQSLRNWSSAYVKWGLALDENRGPHTGGCGTCSPLITVNQGTGEVTRTVDYYTLGHFSKFVLPGAVRVYSSNAPGLVSAAFLNPDGSKALVVFNDSGASRTFQVRWRRLSLLYTLPALAGATMTWTGEPGRAAEARTPARQQIQASSYADTAGLQTESTTDIDGGFDLGYAANGSWAEYKGVDFGPGVRTLSAGGERRRRRCARVPAGPREWTFDRASRHPRDRWVAELDDRRYIRIRRGGRAHSVCRFRERRHAGGDRKFELVPLRLAAHHAGYEPAM